LPIGYTSQYRLVELPPWARLPPAAVAANSIRGGSISSGIRSRYVGGDVL